jgi:two-component system chemotaxis sensor kinase CheA
MNGEYVSMFVDEAREHVRVWSDALMKLEDGGSPSLLQDVFRAAHTIKGMAMTMDFQMLGDLTHRAENLLTKWRDGLLPVTGASIDLLFQTVDAIGSCLDEIENTGREPRIDLHPLLTALEIATTSSPAGEKGHSPQVCRGQSEAEAASSADPAVAAAEGRIREALSNGLYVYDLTLGFSPACNMPMARIVQLRQGVPPDSILYSVPPLDSLAALDSSSTVRMGLALHADAGAVYSSAGAVSEVSVRDLRVWKFGGKDGGLSLIPADIPAADPDAPHPLNRQADLAGNGQEASPAARAQMAKRSARVDSARLDDLLNLMTEFTVARTHLDRAARHLHDSGLTAVLDTIGHLTRRLQELVVAVRMIPVETVFHRYPRMVRDTARKLGKQVEMAMYGVETELDRTVAEEIGDMLIHLLRNALDHGIETPSVRMARGKPAKGRIELRVSAENGQVRIELRDDGGGIDRVRVLEKARSLGLAPMHATIADDQVDQFLFAPGFSTAAEVSALSGRGVGLDAVKYKIESLGGHIRVTSEWEKGTNFTLRFPVHLSLIKGLIVRIAAGSYVIPQSGIAGVVALPPFADLPPETISWREVDLPVIRITGTPPEQDARYGVILQSGDRRAALCVSALLGLHEVIVKPLDRRFRNIRQWMGGTILADGEVALIADPGVLLDA